MERIDKSLNITKNTFQDKRAILNSYLSDTFIYRDEDDDWTYSPWLVDFDDDFVYFDMYTGVGYFTWRVSYSFNGTSASFPGVPVHVTKLSEYKEVVEQDEPSSVEKGILKVLNKFFGDVKGKDLQVIKQFDEEEMIAIEPLYICAGETDGQGDTISLEDTHLMVKSFNDAIESGGLQTSLFHSHKTQAFEVIKGWVNEVECTIGDSVIPEGQPLAKIHFLNEDAWELRKSGDLMGLSIGARAMKVEEV